MNTKENSVVRFLMDEINITEQGNEETLKQAVEVEILPPVDITDKRKLEIYNGISEIDKKLSVISERVEELNSEIDSLTNHADGIDYTIAVASGLLTGLLDSFFGEDIKKITDNKINSKVIDGAKEEKIKKSIEKAQEQARAKNIKLTPEQIKSIRESVEKQFTPNDSSDEESKRILTKAIRYLENNKESPTDKIWNFKGSTITPESHHLDDLSHHASIVGLVASILTQFTRKGFFSDKYGSNFPIEIDEKKGYLIGKSIPAKFVCGVSNWFWHLMSDVAGTSGNPGAGMGIPGPLMSLFKEASSLPILKETKLPEIANKIFEEARFDFRKEISQSVPVLLNDIIVRLAFFIRRLIIELKEKRSFCEINWKNTLPFRNRTVIRMLTIATGTFTAVDVADAAIRSGGFNAACVLRINFVGVGRFALAIGTDIGMGIKKNKKEKERSAALSEYIGLYNIKIYYRKADLLCSEAEMLEQEASMHAAEKGVWKEFKYNIEAMDQLYATINQTCQFYMQAISKMDECADRMVEVLPSLDQTYPGLREKMLGRLK